MNKIEGYLTDLKLLIPGTRISPLNQDSTISREKSPLCVRQHLIVEQLRQTFQDNDQFSDGMLAHIHNFTSGRFRLYATEMGRWGLYLVDGNRTLSIGTQTEMNVGEWHEVVAQEIALSLNGEVGASWLCVVFSSNTNAQIDCAALRENK